MSADGAGVEGSLSEGSHHLLAIRTTRESAGVSLELHGFPSQLVEASTSQSEVHLRGKRGWAPNPEWSCRIFRSK